MFLKTYQKLLVKSYIGPFVLTFFIALFVLLMQFLWKWIDELVGKGLDPGVIAELLLYASFSLVPMALPLAILLSSIMTFGNLGEHYELVAFKSAGISLQRVMQPLIVVAILISVGAFYFSNNAMPFANLKMKSLLTDISKSKPTLNIKEGIFNNDITGFSIRVGKKSENGKELADVIVYDHTEEIGNTSVTIAQTGTMEMSPDRHKLILTLYKGNSYNEVGRNPNKRDGSFNNANRTRDPMMRESFEKMVIIMGMEDFGLKRTDENLLKDNAMMMNLQQISQTTDTLTTELNNGLKHASNNILRGYRYYNLYVEKKQPVKDIKITGKKDLLAGKPKEDKMRILETATNIARNSKTLVENSVNDEQMLMKNISRHQVEWHRKFTLSFACFVLFFIGAPLGAIIRKGGLGLPLVVSVVLFIIYHVISITGEKMAKQNEITAFEGMWLSAAVLLPLGIYLTYKATTDSALFDAEKYIRIFKLITKPFIGKPMALLSDEEDTPKQ